MFNKKPILKYESAIKSYPNSIQTATSKIPEWYKKIPKWQNNEITDTRKGMKPSVKACPPFLDALSCGYIVTLPFDLYVDKVNESPYVMWKDPAFYVDWRERPADGNVVPAGHYPMEYTWKTFTSWEVPKGYSMLVTHPLNRHDLPFTTLSGIIDGGFALPSNGSIPFYIKKDFIGLIEQGTPIMQIIPFKQEKWNLEQTEGLVQEGVLNAEASQLKFLGWYKQNIWNKKSYQ